MSSPLLDRDPAELLRALTQVSHAVSNAVSLEAIMNLAARQAADLLGAKRSLVLLSDDRGQLRIRAWYGLERPEPELSAGAFDENLIVRLVPLLGESSPDRVLAVPLIVRGKVTGLLATALPPGAEEPAEVVLTALADQMAAPLEIARMAEEVRQAQLLAENARLYEAEREARQAAEEGRDVLRAVLEYIPEGITIADAPDVRIRLVSRFGLELLGRPLEEVRGLSAEQHPSVIPMCHPDQESPAPADDLPLTRSIREGATVRGEEWVLLRADGTRVVLLCDAGPIRDKEGIVTGGIMAWREITAHKRMQQQLAQAQRLQAVGKLTGGVAHEVNNMMTVVIGFSRFVLQELPQDHPRRGDVEQIVRAATRAAGITRQLLAFSRQQLLRPAVIELSAMVRDSVPLLRQILGADKSIEVRSSGEPLRVFADAGQLEQVLVNLAANARDAMDPGGRLTIELAARVLDDSYGRAHAEAAIASGRYAALMVSDTGTGMDESTRARVFEPFFTTKALGEGTGLGLATVYGIIKQSDGYIWVYSEVGYGTTFKIYLPLTEENLRRSSGPHPQPSRGDETILVVEDEPMVRHLARQNLEELGYQVLEAGSGEEALMLIERQLAGVDLILSDVVMPGLSAKALARVAAQSRPGLPILFMSGYPGEDVMRRGLLSPGTPLLQKPFSLEELARNIRALLDQSRRNR